MTSTQPLPYLRKGCLPRHFTQVAVSLNSVQSHSIFFISRAGKITEVCLEMYNKKIKNAVYVFFSSKLDPPFISYGMQNTLSRFFFLSLDRPVKFYISQ